MEKIGRMRGLVDYISSLYKKAVEIGIGHYPDIAYSLHKRGVEIFATDIKHFNYKGIKVVVDDITDPDFSIYRDVEIVYSIRPPLELVPYMHRLANIIHADLIVKPLTSDHIEGKLVKHGNTNFFIWKKR